MGCGRRPYTGRGCPSRSSAAARETAGPTATTTAATAAAAARSAGRSRRRVAVEVVAALAATAARLQATSRALCLARPMEARERRGTRELPHQGGYTRHYGKHRGQSRLSRALSSLVSLKRLTPSDTRTDCHRFFAARRARGQSGTAPATTAPSAVALERLRGQRRRAGHGAVPSPRRPAVAPAARSFLFLILGGGLHKGVLPLRCHFNREPRRSSSSSFPPLPSFDHGAIPMGCSVRLVSLDSLVVVRYSWLNRSG